jgi:hypothetical protein
MSKVIIDHSTGKPLAIHIQPRLNTKVVNKRPDLTPPHSTNATWYEVLLALLTVFLVSVAIKLSWVSL